VNPVAQTVTEGGELGETKIHPPYPSVVYPEAHEVNSVSIGTQAPFPSDVYPLGQLCGTGTLSGTQLPLPLLWNPELQIITTVSGTQFPYPSGYYPVGQLTDVGGLAVFFATQFPLLNVNPDAHVTDDDGGRQFPNPSV
jgi:hypothetical protein